MSADFDNWDHGDRVSIGAKSGRIFKAPWWHAWRWFGWLLYRCLGRTMRITLTTGETLRVVSEP